MPQDSGTTTAGSPKDYSWRVASSYHDALLELNTGSGHEASSQADRGDELKQAIGASYDQTLDISVSQFWNWGMYDSVVRDAILRTLDSFDELVSDGYSEQLYYYTLNRVPSTRGTPRRILEIGCGAGVGLNFLSRIEPQSTFVGLDLSREAVVRAHEQYSRPGLLSYVQGDAERLPFDDAQFDVVLNVESSHNYPDLSRFLCEVGRVLRPNGYLSHADVFTDSRYRLMQQCKGESASGLDWLDEQDITDRVKDAIRRRMAPGSRFRRQLSQKFASKPWPLSVAMSAVVKKGYGSDFADPRDAKWKDAVLMATNGLLPRRRKEWNIVRCFSSYRHSLARKRA